MSVLAPPLCAEGNIANPILSFIVAIYTSTFNDSIMLSELSKSFPSAEVALQKLDDYLYALHAPERNKYRIENVKDRRNESLAPSCMYTNVEDVNADLEAGILTEEQAKDIIDNGQTAQQII